MVEPTESQGPTRRLVPDVAATLTEAQTTMASIVGWLIKDWPHDLFPPQPHGTELSVHYFTASELLAARAALYSLGPVDVTVDPDNEEGLRYGRAVVRLPGGVSVKLQADRALWLQAFPEDAVEHMEPA